MLNRRRAFHVIADHTIRLDRHAIKRQRFVKMEMTRNEAGRHQLAAGIVLWSIGNELWLDCDDEAVLHANIDGRLLEAKARKSCITNKKIECHMLCLPERACALWPLFAGERRQLRRWHMCPMGCMPPASPGPAGHRTQVRQSLRISPETLLQRCR